MSYTEIDGTTVIRALLREDIDLTRSDLIGCSIDDGISDDAWLIESIPGELGSLFVQNGTNTKIFPITLLHEGYLEIPNENIALIEKLNNFKTELKNAQVKNAEPIIRAPRFLNRTIKFEPINQSNIADRKIKHLFHFTQIENVPSILEHGIVPRHPEPNFPIIISDEQRFDRRLDCVSVSVSFPNYRMFYRLRISEFPSAKWCVISLNPEILTTLSCLFFPDNAAKHGGYQNSSFLKSSLALDSMFTDNDRPNYLPIPFPTDPQAEVLVEGPIPASMITALNFESSKDVEHFRSLCRGEKFEVEVRAHAEFYSNRDRYIERFWVQES